MNAGETVALERLGDPHLEGDAPPSRRRAGTSSSGRVTADRSYEGDDLRNDAPKFQPGRLPQYLAAVEELKALARERFGKSVLALAVRWVLDQGPTIALWGARDPGQLAPLDEIDGWRIDDDARAEIDAILVRCIRVVAVAESEPGAVGAPDRRRLTKLTVR